MAGRDFRKELAAAAESRDVSGLLAIAYQLLGRVEADDERRARQADKKRKERENRASATSGMSPDVAGRPGTTGDIPARHNTTRTTTTQPNAPKPSAQVIARLGDTALQRDLASLREKFTEDEWEDVAMFFLRRKYVVWAGWANAMLREIGMTSQYQPADLLRVCQDDATLDDKIRGYGVLRSFLQAARIERMGGNRSPPSGAARTGSPSRRDTKVTTGPAAPPTDTAEDIKWQT